MAQPRPTSMAPTPRLEAGWHRMLAQELGAQYFAELQQFLDDEATAGREVYPAASDMFRAFALTPFDLVRVVVVGQDPYHGPGQAHGLSFSVPAGVGLPPSLRNIFRELASDLGLTAPSHGNLEAWAQQGVLLLNTTLTVGAGVAGSHHGRGWERFTDAAIQALNDQRDGIVFLLWGRHARQKAAMIDHGRHHVLQAAHPSPLSASKGFFGCRHFSRTNELLGERGERPIDWSLPCD